MKIFAICRFFFQNQCFYASVFTFVFYPSLRLDTIVQKRLFEISENAEDLF